MKTIVILSGLDEQEIMSLLTKNSYATEHKKLKVLAYINLRKSIESNPIDS